MMRPYYEQDGITIYHGDCLDIVPHLECDVVISDPPYGMAWDNSVTRAEPRRRGTKTSRYGETVLNDDQPFDPSPWIGYRSCVLWGFQHFASRLPVGSTLVWLKRYDDGFGSFLSDADLAWMKGGCGVYCRRDTSLSGESRFRFHPTQKPVGIMRWCIERAKVQPHEVVMDPFMGSGSTLEACKKMGHKAIGIELEEKYCEIAAKRLQQGALPLEIGA